MKLRGHMQVKLVAIALALGIIVSCKMLTHTYPKFISYDHEYMLRFNVLMAKIHNDHWNIAYRYDDDCSAEKQRDPKALERAITTALRAWLQPLRTFPTKKPLVDDFRYLFKAARDSSDVRVTFHCTYSVSYARINTRRPPDIFMHEGTEVSNNFMFTLTHEIGHAFGLSDTRSGSTHGDSFPTTTGGLDSTMGTQPPSLMSSHSVNSPLGNNESKLGEDDKRAIIWLYKHFHAGLTLEDCFFPDYVLEKAPLGCRPKYPLIFEVKHSPPRYALQLLDDDPKIDINAQDAGGMTALHYAVMYKRTEIVERLLARRDIEPALRNKQGQRALDIAQQANLTDMVKLLAAVTPPAVAEDLNGDGTVNILDLVLVADNFGKTGKNSADIDGNGTVDILDLVRVAAAFGETTADAPQSPAATRLVTNRQVSRWLETARQRTATHPAHRRGIHVLQKLLARLPPAQKTTLLANYPNPFHTETWLPYQLAEPAQVTIRIHALNGQLVRTLALGNQPAGTYQNKNRAAHWDGRNTQGESVASGIYFYTLSADDFSTTRKMLLRK